MWINYTIRTFNSLVSHDSAENEGTLVEALQASLRAMNFWAITVRLGLT